MAKTTGHGDERGEAGAEARPARFAALLLLLALAGAGLRLWQLDAQSMSMDEVQDLRTASGGWAAIDAAENRFPPLYHVLLSAWLKVVPGDETGRGFSVVCGVLTILATGSLGRLWGGTRAGLWSAALMAVAPLAVWYSLESRVYGLYMLFAALALRELSAAMQGSCWRHWMWFVLSSLGGVYTHYYFGLLIALAGCYFLATTRRDQPQFWRGMIAFVALGAACLPAAWLLRGDLDQAWGYARTSKFGLGPAAFCYFSLLSGYTLGPSLRELHGMPLSAAVRGAAPWVALLGAPTAWLLGQACYAVAVEQRWRRIGWFATFCLAPPVLIGLVSLAAGFGFSPRHVAWCLTPLCAMLGCGIAAGSPRRVARVCAMVLAVGFAVAQKNRLFDDAHRTEDSRSVAQFVVKESRDQSAPVFALSGYLRDALRFYLSADWPCERLPDAADGKLDEVLQREFALIESQTPAGSAFWLAYGREFHGDPQGKLLAALTERYGLKEAAAFAGYRVYRGERREEDSRGGVEAPRSSAEGESSNAADR